MPAERGKLLAEARAVAEAGAARAPQDAHWPGLLAEILLEAGEPATARAVLEPLVKAGRLPAARRPLYERALSQAGGSAPGR